jgi:oligopeptide transport system ATP-binding protein
VTKVDYASPLLSVVDLKKYFYIKKGFRKTQTLKAVDGVNFELQGGEALGLVGESGCGKTTLGRTIMRLYNPTGGTVLVNGTDICSLYGEPLRKQRAGIQMIFQDPYSSLNPRITVGNMLHEVLSSHDVRSPSEREERVREIIKKVGLEPIHLKRFPHEFSGGQRQRIAIARALILYPRLIVADEPSSALDMSIQAQILNLMRSLQKEMGISYLFITHNLSAASFMCDRIAVMYLGKIVELGNRNQIFRNPCHPYTKALLPLCPVPDPDTRVEQVVLRGDVPSPVDPPNGCTFHTRCPNAADICSRYTPELTEAEPGHKVACYLFEENKKFDKKELTS